MWLHDQTWCPFINESFWKCTFSFKIRLFKAHIHVFQCAQHEKQNICTMLWLHSLLSLLLLYFEYDIFAACKLCCLTDSLWLVLCKEQLPRRQMKTNPSLAFLITLLSGTLKHLFSSCIDRDFFLPKYSCVHRMCPNSWIWYSYILSVWRLHEIRNVAPSCLVFYSFQ